MAITEDSRFNYSSIIKVVGGHGGSIENDRVHMPYAREAVINVSRPDVHEYVVRDGDTWSNIAARFLRGRSDLWWVIAEFSNIVDPFTELYTGKVLTIPAFETVMFEVLNFEDRGVPGETSGSGAAKPWEAAWWKSGSEGAPK